MKWITRTGIRVNRTATCWLIRRFLDPEAEFLFVPAEQVAELQEASGATGFDAPGATYPHRDPDGRCSFAALVHERLARDHLARIVGKLLQQGAAFGPIVLCRSLLLSESCRPPTLRSSWTRIRRRAAWS